MKYHIHEFKIECGSTSGHNHILKGYTESILGLNLLHFHHFWGICSYNGHTHYFSGFTGLPIRTENGHVHKLDGTLESNNHHEHVFNGMTFEEMQYISKKSGRIAIV